MTKFEKVVNWLIGCGYSKIEAENEAASMVRHNQYDGPFKVYTVEQALDKIISEIE